MLSVNPFNPTFQNTS